MFTVSQKITPPASLTMSVDLAQRLMKREGDLTLMPADIVLIFSRGPAAAGLDAEFTSSDIEFCRERALAALEYAAQIEAAD